MPVNTVGVAAGTATVPLAAGPVSPAGGPKTVHVLRIDGRPVAPAVLRALPFLPEAPGGAFGVALAAALDAGAVVLGKLVVSHPLRVDRHERVAVVEALVLWRGALWRSVFAP